MLTKEEFYGDSYKQILRAERDFWNQLEDLMADDAEHFMYITSRIKSPDSILEKMKRKHISEEELFQKMQDIIGFRVVCPFLSDIYLVAEEIRHLDGIRVREEKDYMKNPKDSGYQSYHMIVEDHAGNVIEIQIRTIALDFWAALEHKLRYKKNVQNEELIAGELKRVADNIAALDIDMETLREMINRA